VRTATAEAGDEGDAESRGCGRRSTCHRCPGHSLWEALRRARDSHPTNPSVKTAVRSPMTTVEVADHDDPRNQRTPPSG